MKKAVSLLIIFTILITSVFTYAEREDNIMPLLSELYIMKGDPDGNLRLDDYVSRGEFTKVAVAASSHRNSVSKTLSISPFKDVLYSYWAAPYIQTAVSNGICNGYPDGTFQPENTVLYEEAVTMLLKLLGYNENDFGIAWPYGQIGIAEKIGLCDDLNLSVGTALTRRDVSRLCYNLLNSKPKNSPKDYIVTLDYNIIEDVILIASSNEDTSVGSGKVFTSAGLFKLGDSFNYADVGKKGDIVIKNGDELISFVPSSQQIKQYNIYQVLGSDIIVYDNGQMDTLDIQNSLTVYNKSKTFNLSQMLGQLASGDVLTTYASENGVLDYGMVKTDELKGPYTVKTSNYADTISMPNPAIMRNGVKANKSDIKINDIAYYSSALNTIWCYSKTKTGVYEKALPNKDMPTSIVISGETYAIEGVGAYNKLASGGEFNYGDSITVLLGRTNQIADVLTVGDTTTVVYGYFYGVGSKQFTKSDNTKYTSYFAKIALPDGNSYEYVTNQNFDNIINSIVKVTFSSGTASLGRVNEKVDISGNFSWKNKSLGGKHLSDEIEIIDVSTLENSNIGAYAMVFPQRLEGVTISSGSILYCEYENGKIKSLILNNVTGDAYSYGIVTSATKSSKGMYSSGTYTYDIGGNSSTFTSPNKLYNVASGQPARFSFVRLGTVDTMQPLERLNSSITDVTASAVISNGISYTLSDKAVVYKKDFNYDYTIIPLTDIIDSNDYNLTAYFDKDIKYGGRIRVIIASPK